MKTRNTQTIQQSSVPPFVSQVMDYDECLEELGEFGPWQITITLLVWIPAMVDGITTLTRCIIIIITTRSRISPSSLPAPTPPSNHLPTGATSLAARTRRTSHSTTSLQSCSSPALPTSTDRIHRTTPTTVTTSSPLAQPMDPACR